MGFGTLQPEYQIIPNGFLGYLQEFDPATYPNPYDPDKAKELLAQAGYPDGFTISFHSPGPGAFGSSMDQDTTIVIQNMLAEVGINCELNFPESGAATELRMNGWDGLLAYTIGAFPNSTIAIRLNLDPEYQYLVSAWRPVDEIIPVYNAAREASEANDNLVRNLHQIYIDNMIVIPLYSSMSTAIIKDNVHGTGLGDYSMNTIWTPWNAWRSQQ
jgi:ABC-type transport system substrate-binding protein